MTPDPWQALRRHTPARLALGRAGVSLPTAEWLALAAAHALARDAVHLPLDVSGMTAALEALQVSLGVAPDVKVVASAATDRATYLRRPDLGRCLCERDRARLQALQAASGANAANVMDVVNVMNVPNIADAPDLVIAIGDGLSALAVHRQAVPLLAELLPRLRDAGLRLAPLVLARQARVALGDNIGSALGARAVLMLVGERPGLSSPDSLGAYLTWAPQRGRADSQRNCISNIRSPDGLPHALAAHRIAWLLLAAARLGATGVALKDGSDGDGTGLGHAAGLAAVAQAGALPHAG